MRQPDAEDYADFFRAQYSSVLRTVFVILHDNGRAEEVTQDSFLKLYEHWRMANRVEHPAAWVRAVAVHAAIRRGQRDRVQAPVARLPEGASTDQVRDVDLERAMAVLSPRQRAAVALYYLDDRPVDEIADLMGVSTSTVKQHLHRARAELALVLAEAPEEVDAHD